MKRHIPNSITVLNLLAGCFSVYFALSGELALGAWMIGLAALFDFLDGTMARLLNARSEIGKILDSLADVVSFGLAPGFLALELIKATESGFHYLHFIAFLIPVFSALRLAIFSADDRQAEQFLGVPTPANALLFASFPLILGHPSRFLPLESLITNPWSMSAIIIVTSALLVVNLPMLSLKFKDFSWLHNRQRYLLIGIALILLPWLTFTAIPLVFLAYILVSALTAKKS